MNEADPALQSFAPWLYAAAVYNFVWGVSVIIFPEWVFRLLKMPVPHPLAFWQTVGMFVLVYAPAYAWAARLPNEHAHIVLVGMLGKILGPLGFLVMLSTGRLPLRFELVLVTNDLIWWLPFTAFLLAAARLHGGWRAFLLGD
jgi:hypothetical protein